MRLPRQYERREQHALSRPTGILYNVQQAHVKEGLKHDDLHPSAVVCPDVDNIKTPALQRPLIEAAGYRPQHVLQMRASSSAASSKSIMDEQTSSINMSILKLHPLSSTSIVGRLELLRILLTSFSHHKKYLFLGTEPNRRSNEKRGLVFPTSKAKL